MRPQHRKAEIDFGRTKGRDTAKFSFAPAHDISLPIPENLGSESYPK
jgi:hypothetical protein